VRLNIAVLIILSISTLAASPNALAAAPALESEAARVDQLFERWNRTTSPGCAMAVMKDGRILHEAGYGMANLEHEAKITPTTVFNVGSIAKQFTAAAILMLAEEGKVSLDDPIRKYITELPDFGTPVTLRQMLRHTSGLRDYEQLLHFDGWRLDSPDLLTDGDIMHIMSLQKELNFPPGSNYSYSNTNYMLLAQVVSRVSKQSFPDFTMTRLFQPLGMKHTHFRVDHGEMIKNVAYAYIDKDGGGFDLCLPNYDTVGATNLFTTVEDLARWEENSYTGRVGGDKVIKQLHQPGKLSDGTPLNYAPGMFVGLGAEESGDAGDAGYRADILRFPDDHFSVLTLCNLGSIDPMELSRKIADIYRGGKFSAALSAATGPASSFHPDPKQLAAYTGTYVDQDENLVLKFDQRGESLWGESFTGPDAIGPAQLEALSENRFRGVGVNEIDFGMDSNHRELTAKYLGMPSVQYRRVPDYKPTVAKLREFVGVYSSKELDVPSYVTLVGEALVLYAPKMPEIALAPIANDLFIGGDRHIHFTRDSQGRVSGLLMSGTWNRVQNLRFERSSP
jgi:CubicO group peptidase (beta-lactamase class C family)